MTGAPWTEAEIATIKQARAEGLYVRDITRRLPGRTQFAVKQCCYLMVRNGEVPKMKTGGVRAHALTNEERLRGAETKRRRTLAATGIATWEEYQLYRRKGFSRQELIERHRGGV